MPSAFTFDGLFGTFVTLRHYFKGLATTWVASSTSTLIDNVWRVEGTYFGTDTYEEYVLYPNFLVPSSNRYTPDHFVTDHYYVNLPSTTHLNPLPIDVAIKFKPGTRDMYLSVDSLNFPDWYYLDLPQITPKWPL
jgi:hypothetical protein